MDYRMVYRDFIASRKATEQQTAAREYTERHHILPRCLGGTNDPTNIVRLTYREHIFAHALLLKGAKSEKETCMMAASMSAVLNFDASGQRDMAKAQRSYTWARKLHGLSIGGNAHPGYKHDEHIFWGVDGKVIRGTRQELIEETGLPFRSAYDLVNGHREHCKGWCSTQEEAQARADSNQARLTRHERIDHRLYNVDGRTIAKDSKVMDANGVDRRMRSQLRENGYADGWCLDPEEAVLRAEGRWRRPESSKKSAHDFGNPFFAPISLQSQEDRRKPMSKQFHRFIKFLALNTVEKKTDDYPYAFAVAGLSSGLDVEFMNAKDWATAHKLWLDALDAANVKIGAKKHAKSVLRAMKRERALYNQELSALCRSIAGMHGLASTSVHTLYSRNGESVSGTLTKLPDLVGLPYDRVRDLVTTRRRYVKGWAMSPEEAKRGYLPAGRPRKPAPPPGGQDKAPEPEFFEAGASSLF